MLPAPGQGALAVQCRSDDRATLALLSALDDDATRQAVTAERQFLLALGGGCTAPVAAYARVNTPDSQELTMTGRILSTDGRMAVQVSGHGKDATQLSSELAQQAIQRGAQKILNLVEEH
jgi:hydroxymethylbilane synthase